MAKDELPESVKKAMRHPDKLGAGAEKRRRLSPENIKKAVMAEYDRGTLYSGSGSKVRKRDEAWAIANSEARAKRKRMKERD